MSIFAVRQVVEDQPKFDCRPLALLLLMMLWLVPNNALLATEKSAVEAITRPSQNTVLSFTRPGRISEVAVKEGDRVDSGQLLARLDDQAEQAQLVQLKAQAEDDKRIRAAKADLAQKNVDMAKIRQIFENGVATEWEMEHAKLDVTIAELSVELALFEQEQNQRTYHEATIQLERMRLKSPISGAIEEVSVEVGESVDGVMQVVRVVSVDPLWIDVPVPLTDAMHLKYGQTAEIICSETDATVLHGTIVHKGLVADAASNTLKVRLEVPNKAGRPAGERVMVSFSGSDTHSAAAAE